ncbi:MAG: DNA-binding protein [Candidatus Margulisiibacteriota bacterium]|nr:MAG: hypothetical protein A2X09_15120 [Bacteroidetes bacterium GWF2_43_11]OGH99541.1 MAG: hypothetical protein A2X43_00170 [Candidatus Margulisbacteria bacterium GWD2_39_127]PZM79886.1 MAG: DNA-binding protein [Candidatus Margulisiibacteriota bacterium]HAR62804.1 DNA-binding protein [Candidatus Margulisiibacteriota bacterium]HCT86564.1 DNA-binding protein [Candidatus Margulisiibacteriota bacterium]
MNDNRVRVLKNKAEQDYTTVTILMSAQGSSPDIIVFHIQQMIEKLLKAFLVKMNVLYRFTHDITYLLEEAINIDGTFRNYYEISELLAPYAVIVRYEEGYEISFEEAEVLLDRALKLREKILCSIT